MTLATSHEEIAMLTGSSKRDVSRWLRLYPTLRERWASRVHQLRRTTKLSQVEAAIERIQPASRVELIAACRTDISWLRLHEPMAAEKLLARIPAERSRQLPLFSSAVFGDHAEDNPEQLSDLGQRRAVDT